MSDDAGAGGPKPGESGPGGPPPLIEYPTFYTFKAMGLAADGFRALVVALVAGVVGPVDPASVTTRPSSAGKYESLSIHVFLRSEEQRRSVYEAFHAEKRIVWYV